MQAMSSYKGHLDLNTLDDDDNDEDVSDDEVFTHSSKSISLDENGVNKPLMAPRQRAKDSLKTKVRKVPPLRVIWASAFYFLVILSTIIGVICLVVFLINVFMKKYNKAENQKTPVKEKWVPCDKITTDDVWIRIFPKLTTETAIRLSDLNSDGIEDIIFGFGTGADAFYYPPIVCQVYFTDSNFSCGGGIAAIDGKFGTEIWRHYTPHEIFALNCNVDLDGDGVKDCVGGGRMANFRAISGKTGKLLWDFDDTYAKIETSNVYTPQYVSDVDADGVPDLVVIHGGDPLKKAGSKTRLIGRLMIVSGKTGHILRWTKVPDGRESYYSPQVLTHPDGSEIVLFGTGGETHGGSLWCISLKDLARADITKARSLYTDKQKGVMTPPVLVDITGDGILDIVMAMFNSTVVAFNGFSFNRIWSYHQPSSESYSTPGVGYFNNDTVPDFIINYQVGPGFPIYYYTQTTILDGRNGLPLLREPIKMVVGTQSSPLTVSMRGQGNDIFLYWVSDCHGSQNVSQLEFDFLKGTSVHEQTRADFCKLRFKQKLFTRMYALSSNLKEPGFVIYDSDQRKSVEYSNPINYTAWGLEFLYRHPEYQEKYQKYLSKPENYDYQELSDADLEERQNDYRYQNMLKNHMILDNMEQNPEANADYESEDRQDGAYPSYYAQRNFPNLGSNYYDSSDYYKDTQLGRQPYQMTRRRLKPSNGHAWPRHMTNSQRYHDYAADAMTNPNKYQRQQASRDRRKRSLLKPKKLLLKGTEQKRTARHVGPHDGGGVQRVISTGTLAPPLKSGDGVDIIFATFWFYPSSIQGLLPEDKECIAAGMRNEEERFKAKSQFRGMDHDAYEEMVTEECLRKTGNLNHKDSSSNVEYNPFNRPMGQLTLYRLHLSCKCTNFSMTDGQNCSKMLPYKDQLWPAYMGRFGNSVANVL